MSEILRTKNQRQNGWYWDDQSFIQVEDQQIPWLELHDTLVKMRL